MGEGGRDRVTGLSTLHRGNGEGGTESQANQHFIEVMSGSWLLFACFREFAGWIPESSNSFFSTGERMSTG